MRLSYAYFAAIIAVTFVSSGNAVAATDGTTGISAMTLPNAVEATVGGEKRSLRSHNNKNLEDESDDEALYDEEDEEERTRGDKMFTVAKLDDAANGNQLIARFKKWVEFKYNPQRLPAALKDDKYTKLRQKFRTWYYHHRQQ
ncbi:hypothetical protein DVH05_001137 [Phytophthora capsici]|nr:hypothetical protein DVH05_001137 [Phytophthora capsici]